MRYLPLPAGLLLIVLCVFAEARGSAESEVIVKWRTTATAQSLNLPRSITVESVRAALPSVEATAVGLERIQIVSTESREAAAELAEGLSRDPRVEYAELRQPRYTDGGPAADRWGGAGSLDGVPDDPFYSLQWGLRAIEAEAAWDITRGSADVAIAVVDVGVFFDHPELAATRWTNVTELAGISGIDDDGNGFADDVYGWDFIDNDGDPSPSPLAPEQSHGTHVAGLASATRNNGIGITGLAPSCRIMGVRAGSGNSIGYGYEGIYYACRAGAKVINCSWGGDAESAYERDIIHYVIEHGCIVVVSAGNGNSDQPHYPAAIEGVISVAATQLGDQAANFTQRGAWVKISAPGVAMISTVIGMDGGPAYDTYQGTSMAAPLVAAACGLVAGRYPALSGEAIAERVVSSADPIDTQNGSMAGQLGLGRLNIWRALSDQLAGLRLADVRVEESQGNGDGRVRAGEVAQLTIAVWNDLIPLASVVARVATTDPEIVLIHPQVLYGAVPLGGPHWSDGQVQVRLPEDMPRGYVLPLAIDWIDETGHVVGRATAHVELDPTWVAVDNGLLGLGFVENGSLGYWDYQRDLYRGPGLRVGERSNAIYHGSFLLAADGQVSDNAYGNEALDLFDWVATGDSTAHLVTEPRGDLEARTTFEDYAAELPLFARVDAAASGYTAADSNGFLLLEYILTNRSVNPWNEVRAGFFIDWDLGSSSGNVAAYDTLSNTVYVRQVAPGHPLVGLTSVTHDWSSFYIVNNRAEIDPPALWNDTRKWTLLQAGMTEPPTDPMDLSTLMSVGPLSLASHGQVALGFAFVTGESMEEMRANAALARASYSGVVLPPRPVTRPEERFHAALYPNPLPQGQPLRLEMPFQGRVSIRFYNVLGQLVAELGDYDVQRSGTVIERGILGRASGLLLYRVESAAGSANGKILLLR